MPAYVLGAIVLALPALAVAWLFLWKRHMPVFWFAVALILVGVGYLTSTGASGDIGRKIAPNLVAPPVLPVPAR